MKKIAHFLHNKKLENKTPLDDKSILYVFNRVIREEYGNRGMESLKMEYLKGKNIFIKASNSNWANEIWLNRNAIIEKLNRELGSDEISNLSI